LKTNNTKTILYKTKKNSKKIEKLMIEMKKKDCICNIFGSLDHFLTVKPKQWPCLFFLPSFKRLLLFKP